MHIYVIQKTNCLQKDLNLFSSLHFFNSRYGRNINTPYDTLYFNQNNEISRKRSVGGKKTLEINTFL